MAAWLQLPLPPPPRAICVACPPVAPAQVGLVELSPRSRVLHKVRHDSRGRRVLVPSRLTMLLVR